MRHLFTTTALGLVLAVSPALAQSDQTQTPPAQPETQQNQQTSPDAGTTGQQPSATPDAQKDPSATDASPSGDTAQTEATKPTGKTAAAVSGDRASDLIGAAVENTRGENVGEINDLIIAKDGSTSAALIGVGGFLGLGAKNVAIEFDKLNVKRQDGALSVTVAMSSEELEALPAHRDEESTYGTGSQESDTQMNQKRDSQGGSAQPDNQ